MKFPSIPSLAIGVAICSLYGSATAAPIINAAPDTLGRDVNITITGTQFGIKEPAAPFRYHNFQDGNLGDFLPSQSQGGFYTINNAPGTFSKAVYSDDLQRYPGDIVSFHDLVNGRNSSIGLVGVPMTEMYMSAWVYRHDINGNASLSTNQKLWGNFGHSGGSDNYGQPQQRVDSYWGSPTGQNAHLYAQSNDCDGSGTVKHGEKYFSPIERTKIFNQWFRQERYMKTGGGPNDHAMVAWASADLMGATPDRVAEITGADWALCGEPYNYIYDYFMFLHYLARDSGAGLHVYLGELYLDFTLARIELGNKPVYEECTHREIQIPSAWDGGSISFTTNLGTFQSGEEVYLFVIDENGNSSPGKMVVLDESALGNGSEGPGQPGTPVRR